MFMCRREYDHCGRILMGMTDVAPQTKDVAKLPRHFPRKWESRP